MSPLAGGSSIVSLDIGSNIIWVAVGLIVLLVFLIGSRLVARVAADQLVKRHVRPDTVVMTRRVITFLVIALGLMAALSLAAQSANVALFGLVLATIVAALGVQDLLRDYVSGYYVLLERHLRVGDRITLDLFSGTITEVRLRVTLLKTDEGNVVVVPNSELFTKPVMIHTLAPDEVRREPSA